MAAVGSSTTMYSAWIWIAKHLRHFKMISKNFEGANDCKIGSPFRAAIALLHTSGIEVMYPWFYFLVKSCKSPLQRKFMCFRFIKDLQQTTCSFKITQSFHQYLTAHTSRSFMIGLQTKSRLPRTFTKFDNSCSKFSPFIPHEIQENLRIEAVESVALAGDSY